MYSLSLRKSKRHIILGKSWLKPQENDNRSSVSGHGPVQLLGNFLATSPDQVVVGRGNQNVTKMKQDHASHWTKNVGNKEAGLWKSHQFQFRPYGLSKTNNRSWLGVSHFIRQCITKKMITAVWGLRVPGNRMWRRFSGILPREVPRQSSKSRWSGYPWATAISFPTSVLGILCNKRLATCFGPRLYTVEKARWTIQYELWSYSFVMANLAWETTGQTVVC